MLEGHKGGFGCKNRARDYHSSNEVASAIEKLKKKYPNAMITIYDLAMVAHDLAEDAAFDGHDEPSSDFFWNRGRW